jgi:hypothetical protein
MTTRPHDEWLRQALTHPRLSRLRSMTGRYQCALLRLYAGHRYQPDGLPTSGRFLFYEGVQARDWPKHDERKVRRVDTDVSEALTHLRAIGLIPWTDIRDETRSLKVWRYGATVVDYLRDSVPEARINPWDGDAPPLMLCESRSLAGVLDDLLFDYLVPVGPTNGQTAGFLHTDVIPLLREGPRRVLYLGDFDWQGGQIEQHTRTVIEQGIGWRFTPDTWQRLALTERQVQDYQLPVVKKLDRRYKPPKLTDAVETEALSQTIIVQLVRAALEELLPEPLATVLAREARQRQQVLKILRTR